MTKTKKFLNGFTLAEILMVLVIIGIISAMAIPALISNVKKESNKSRWKSTYSLLTNAVGLLKVENDNLISNICNLGNENQNETCIRDAFLSKLKSFKNCDFGKYSGKCYLDFSKVKKLKCANGGEYDVSWWYYDTAMVANNGVVVIFWTWNTDSAKFFGTEPLDSRVIIDVNGSAEPNTIGEDIFALVVKGNNLIPMPIDGYIPFPSSYSGTTAQSCGWDNSTKLLFN